MMNSKQNEKQVLEIFERLRRAMLSNDDGPIKKHVAEDYFGCDAGGRVHDREAMLNAYGPGGVDLEKFEVTEIQTKSWKNTVLVSGNVVLQGFYEDIQFSHDSRFLDVYAKRDNIWQVVASQVTDRVDN